MVVLNDQNNGDALNSAGRPKLSPEGTLVGHLEVGCLSLLETKAANGCGPRLQ